MLYGHTAERGTLAQLATRQALGPAHIFTGPEGIGKKLVALELAQTLLCLSDDTKPCGNCRECKLIAAKNHPDVLVVEARDTEQWNIEGIRSLLHTLGLKPFQGKARVIIFNDGENLSAQAVNTLLKCIEEPRPHSYFIVVTQNSNSLLPTLRSRCQSWFFKPLRAVDMSRILKSDHFTKVQEELTQVPIEQLAQLAHGSLASLENLAQSFDFWEQCCDDLIAISNGDLWRAMQLTEQLKGDKDKLRLAFRFFRTFAHQQLRESPDAATVGLWGRWIAELLSFENYLFHRN
ncbi:MAG: AAA family ATPase, partial [Bdellovibrionales bacterium]|nr:AAA family ATPase [Bdellovibrionales bacterium]